MDWYSVRCELVQTIIPQIVIVPYPTVDEVGRSGQRQTPVVGSLDMKQYQLALPIHCDRYEF
jgi:hypothetical protein